MARAKSISAEELNKAAVAAARTVLGDNAKRFGKTSVGWFPDIGTVGIILHDPDLARLNAGDLLDISTKIAGEMRSVTGDARVGAHVFPGGATAGYFPRDLVITEQLF